MDHFLTSRDWIVLPIQLMLYAALAPLLLGWIKKVKATLQNRRGPSVWQGYRELYKLLGKDIIVPRTASPLFRATPYIVFTATLAAASVVPLIAIHSPMSAVADIIVIAGLLALARFFQALAAMDTGTAFGGMGASREMLVAALAEPAMLMAVFTLAMTAHSTNLANVMDYQLSVESLPFRPSYLFAMGALLLVAIAETGRIPIDNPTTHLELTMVHEAMILEYSGRYLALMEWAGQIKLVMYSALICNVFIPWGIATELSAPSLFAAAGVITLKAMVLTLLLAVTETGLAKMRLFRVPEYLNVAFLLALLGLLSHVILEVGR